METSKLTSCTVFSTALKLAAFILCVFLPARPAFSLDKEASTINIPQRFSQLPQIGDQSADNSIPFSGNIANSEYLLGTGDRLQISVFNAADYGGEFGVLPGGVLNLPLVGEVPVAGLTIQQASDVLSNRLQEYVRRPRVSLSLLAARPLQVAIAGEVNRPGAYTLLAEGPTEGRRDILATPTLTQAISQAGGITQSADIRDIVVARNQAGAANANASDREITVDLWQLLKAGQIDADLPLQHGDRIFIPQVTALSLEDSVELASASFSPDEITVNVVGEVESPGSVLVPPNTPLNQALLSAGGFNIRARQSTVTLIRLNDNGSVAKQEIDINFEAGLDGDSNPPLRPNDTIVVGRNGLTRVTDTLGTVLSPINNGFGLFRLLGL